jgi:hypothetical protein
MSPRLRKILASVMFLGLAAALSGCARPPEPQYVRSADLGKMGGALSLDRPIIVEFQEGDIIPLQFTLSGPFVQSPEGAPPIPLRVARRFFLRIDKDGLRSSVNGKDFDQRSAQPGQFQAGVGVTKEGVKAHISIRTPTPPGISP